MSNLVEQMEEELAGLTERVEELEAFRRTPACSRLPTPQQGLLGRQLTHMVGYKLVLTKRLNMVKEEIRHAAEKGSE